MNWCYNDVEGKINAIKFAREHNVPFLGICLGMQMAVVEFARSYSAVYCLIFLICLFHNNHSFHINSSISITESEKFIQRKNYYRISRLNPYLKSPFEFNFKVLFNSPAVSFNSI